jgi:predicted MFS family arabinose efflux permease
VHVPTVKQHYGVGEQALALAMLASGVGALLALMQAGRIVGRFGPRGVAVVTGLLSCGAVALLVAGQAYVALLALMAVYGAAGSLFDVSINAEASELERRAGRPVMSGFHALFSLGGMAGAAVGAGMHHAGVAPQAHLLGAALALGGAVLVGARVMLKLPPSREGREPLSLPTGALSWIGLLAAVGLVAEGAMYDWSVLFLKQERASDAATASLAYASFSAAMAAARFGGDRVRARLAPVALLRASGGLAALGMLLALVLPSPWAALFGFALVGLGLANVVPVLFTCATRVPGVTPAHGIAAVSSVGYLGMMAGPPLIGVIAEHASLTLGLGTVAVFAVLLGAAARRALRPLG